MEKRTNAGYEIIETYRCGSDNLAVGHNPNAVEPFVCWWFSEPGDYYWGYYCKSLEEAQAKVYERMENHALAILKASDD